MNQRIIYQTDEGGVAVIIPAADSGLSIAEIARKDVPAGVPFKIIDTVEVPDDRTFRAAWEADMTSPHGTGIGVQAWFIEQYKAEIATINAEPMPARLPDRDQTAEQYDEVVVQWEASKVARIGQINSMIAVQQQELAA